MTHRPEDEQNSSDEIAELSLEISPSSAAAADMIRFPQTDWGQPPFVLEEIAGRYESLDRKLETVTTEYDRIRERTKKLRKQLQVLQAIVRAGDHEGRERRVASR